ncbi:hypothetical protein E2C01_031644 [Portunus trituberculatus]|uniref:Uncharacterized protein n=1 Tax=Portunus trituberculatus TaxID=210409 RepID=A0A5B7EU10_PORTR|nr:hypothetical protein [Portunus trituberculatus]
MMKTMAIFTCMNYIGGKLDRWTRHETCAMTIHWALRKQKGVLLKRGIKPGNYFLVEEGKCEGEEREVVNK